MIYPDSTKLRDKIVGKLSLKEYSAKELLTVFKDEIGVSGIYKVLSQLEVEGVILKKQGQYQLSNEWKKSVLSILRKGEDIEINDGERITYSLNSVYELDKHWKHYAFLLLNDESIKTLFYYNPHQFWIFLDQRGKSEEEFIKYAEEKKIRVLHTIGGSSVWDKEFRSKYRSSNYRINLESLDIFSEVDNISLFGEYILNTKIDKRLANLIDKAYTHSLTLDELRENINNAVSKFPKSIFSLERNARKAERYQKRLSKNFAVKV